MGKSRIQELFLLHSDFYIKHGEVPICGTYITDLEDRILAQFWLCNPNLANREIAQSILDDIFMIIDARLSAVKVPRKITPEFLEATALAVVSFLTGHVRDSEAGQDFSSLIPAPLWAPQDYYRYSQPPGEDSEWEVEAWDQ